MPSSKCRHYSSSSAPQKKCEAKIFVKTLQREVIWCADYENIAHFYRHSILKGYVAMNTIDTVGPQHEFFLEPTSKRSPLWNQETSEAPFIYVCHGLCCSYTIRASARSWNRGFLTLWKVSKTPARSITQLWCPNHQWWNLLSRTITAWKISAKVFFYSRKHMNAKTRTF